MNCFVPDSRLHVRMASIQRRRMKIDHQGVLPIAHGKPQVAALRGGPGRQRALGYSAQSLQSVVSAYAVASSGFLLFGGRAADLLGRRRIFITGLALCAGASLIGGLATTPGVLLVARAAQGFGGALVFPATLALINTTFAEGPERNRALAVWGGAGAAGLVIGVLLGGVLTQAFGWESVFFVNVPLASLAALLSFPLIPGDQARPDTHVRPARRAQRHRRRHPARVCPR